MEAILCSALSFTLWSFSRKNHIDSAREWWAKQQATTAKHTHTTELFTTPAGEDMDYLKRPQEHQDRLYT
jgi:hypothetical protein